MKNIFTLFKSLLAISIGVVVFFAIKPYIARATEPDVPLIDIPQEANLHVDQIGEQTIIIESADHTKSLGVNDIPNVDPVLGNRYVVWSAQFQEGWQVMLYDLRAQKMIQLTSVGNNVHPVTDNELIAWESQVDGVWQVMVFDGTQFKQVTTTTTAIANIDLERNILTYQQQAADQRGWIGYVYDTQTQQSHPLIDTSTYIASLHISRGVLSWTDQEGHYYTRPTENTQYYPAPTAPAILVQPEDTPAPTTTEPDSSPTDSLATPSASASATVPPEATTSATPALSPSAATASDSAVNQM